ncbi:hypothetical protein [Hymenobacter metallicola]|uniref:Uncharacterized protein n=1 Tax=Hymenobacter metallicola TaxID=2563114 RepID=A0A4Z0Q0S7_9BACT|nr:hypothetical protein [Hymenobacter metallicola]TGE23567.1 hypothetical protein E5K02_20490 [Hymenobacter metallicola]
MESNARVKLSARVAKKTGGYSLIEIRPGFDEEPWQMELYHEIAKKLGPEEAAAFVAERYLLDHPTQLVAVGRQLITALVLQVLAPDSE